MKAIKNWVLSMTSPIRESKETITISPRHSLGSSYGALSEYSLESLYPHSDDSEVSYQEILDLDAQINDIEIREDGQIDKTGIEILNREIDTEVDVSDREIDDQYFIACDVHDFSIQEAKDESTETELGNLYFKIITDIMKSLFIVEYQKNAQLVFSTQRSAGLRFNP